MRNAALTLGVIAGIIGLVIGFFGYGYTLVVDRFSEVAELTGGVERPGVIRAMSMIAPILAIAGGAMARSQNTAGGVLMLLSAGGMYWAFGYGLFTMFPIAMCGLGGVLALLARTPDKA